MQWHTLDLYIAVCEIQRVDNRIESVWVVDHQFAFILTDVHVRPFFFFYRNPQRELHLDEPCEVLDRGIDIIMRAKFDVDASVFTKFMFAVRDYLVLELKDFEVVELRFKFLFIFP